MYTCNLQRPLRNAAIIPELQTRVPTPLHVLQDRSTLRAAGLATLFVGAAMFVAPAVAREHRGLMATSTPRGYTTSPKKESHKKGPKRLTEDEVENVKQKNLKRAEKGAAVPNQTARHQLVSGREMWQHTQSQSQSHEGLFPDHSTE